jgi:hypothetical protein
MATEFSTNSKMRGPVQPPNRAIRFKELSAPRRALVRLCQAVNFGQLGAEDGGVGDIGRCNREDQSQ